jgi:hypothetical protein
MNLNASNVSRGFCTLHQQRIALSLGGLYGLYCEAMNALCQGGKLLIHHPMLCCKAWTLDKRTIWEKMTETDRETRQHSRAEEITNIRRTWY